MEYFFSENFKPGMWELLLSVEESHHARHVLRTKPGEPINLLDGKGHRISGLVISEEGRQLLMQVENIEYFPFPSENTIKVASAIIRPNRMDWLVEKLCELGVEKIVPVICKNNSVRHIKHDHLKKVAVSALKQSEQFYLPEITEPRVFAEWIKSLRDSTGEKFIADKSGSPPPEAISTANNRAILAIGPESGFAPEELQFAENAGFHRINLGGSILRSETAAVVAVSRLKLFFDVR
jgi:16S rRNA (uracil1498-N3)-methyltransferase